MAAIANLPPSVISQLKSVTGNPLTAKVVFLGDIHTDKTQRKLRRIVLDTLAKPGDIVLRESRQRYLTLNPDSHVETRGRRDLLVMGWDDIETIKDSNKHVAFQYEMTMSGVAREKAGKTTPFDNEITAKALSISLNQADKQLLGERNEWMFGAIRNLRNLYPDRTIFVIAGNAHLDQDLLERVRAIASICRLIFNDDPANQEDGHLEGLVADNDPKLKAHLIPYRNASGPFALLRPTCKEEDLRPSRVPSFRNKVLKTVAAVGTVALLATAVFYLGM